MSPANQVVVRFLDGTIIKGVTHDIHKSRPSFHLSPTENQAKTLTISYKDLKAVFFVLSYEGEVSQGKGHVEDSPDRPGYGRKAEVYFRDGETITGFIQAYHRDEPMFLLVPDKKDNNDRIFISRRSVRKLRWI